MEKTEKDMTERDNEYMDSLMKALDTQDVHKLWNYFADISKTEKYLRKIKQLRKKYDIPEKGYVPDEGQTMPPPQWKHSHTIIDRQLDKEIDKLCYHYHLHHLYWNDRIKDNLFYNIIEQVWDYGYGLCMFTDLNEEKRDPYSADTQEADNRFFPLAIRISPHASQRDIIDFVKKSYNHMIKRSQSLYLKEYKMEGIMIGKLKKKKPKIQERNDFIYEHKDLPRKEITTMVSKKFKEVLDYAYIGKIISLEKKKREKK